MRETKNLIHLLINEERLVTTGNHPFYVAGKGFVWADNLHEGDELCTAEGKAYVHTYHVGMIGVWVRNYTKEIERKAHASFENEEKLRDHYNKHKNEFKGIFESEKEYLQGAQDVMQNGYKVEYMYKGELRTGYVEFMENSSKGQAKFAFVGTNNKGFITTFHVESGSFGVC